MPLRIKTLLKHSDDLSTVDTCCAMTSHFCRALAAAALLVPLALAPAPLSSSTETPPQTAAAAPVKKAEHPLVAGKHCLDAGDYEKAVTLFTAAYDTTPALRDYVLLWRAAAYEKAGDAERALGDVRALRERFKESPLLKQARTRELDLARKAKDPALAKVYESFVRDYPSHAEAKFAYATFLKENGEQQKAKTLFKEVYLSVCPLSSRARAELSPSALTVEDLLKRGKNLNTAWLFEESEKVFREALRKDTAHFRGEALEGLALSLFRQKRYKEAAALYKEINSDYWRARSLYRAGEIDTLRAELPALAGTGDKRIASVLIAYGTKKRREGATGEALEIFQSVLSRYPAAKEEALWAVGWTHYRARDYEKALAVLSQLAAASSDPKYAYWSMRCREHLAAREHDPEEAASAAAPAAEPVKVALLPKEGARQSFYSLLSALRAERRLPALPRASLKAAALNAERAELLAALGFRQEAAAELLQLAKKNPSPAELVAISASLKELGDYKMSMSTIAKLPYSEELHELYYPLVYWPEVEEAAKGKGIDPYLVLSVMREESRFASDARSIAGALGLMQLMPQTAQQLKKGANVRLAGAADLYEPEINIRLGAHYLNALVQRMGSIPLALAAYNGGEEAVRDWLGKGEYRTVDEFIEDIPYDETRDYVKKVLTSYFEYLRFRPGSDLLPGLTSLGNL